jgi:hypothetical protein
LHTNSDENFQFDSSKPGVLKLGEGIDNEAYKDGDYNVVGTFKTFDQSAS